MAFSASVRDTPVAQINITPLVDVMLVLLVIFMVSAPLVTRPLDASLPQPSPNPAPTQVPRLQLQIASDGSYWLDGRLIGDAQLGEQLREAVVADPRTQISLEANAQADYQRMVSALSTMRESGLANIAIQP